MPKVKISEYSATANSNTDVASINIDEGCAPSGINNAIRAVMGHLKDFQQGTNGDPFNGPHNGTVGATTPSTGAFTTLTTTDNITVTKPTGVPKITIVATTGTNEAYFQAANTGGSYYFGAENSAGSWFGATAYAFALSAPAGREINTLIGGNKIATLTSTSLYTASTINVGIGTSSPAAKLEVRDTNPTILLSNSSSRYGYMQWENSGSELRVGTDGVFGIRFDTNALRRMTLDDSGNLGLGVTPSTGWNTSYGVIQGLGGWSISSDGSNSNSVDFMSNAYKSGASTYTYLANSYATRYQQKAGVHAWYNAPSTTGTITFTQAMTLGSNGNLLVGSTTAASGFARLSLVGGESSGTGPNSGVQFTYNSSTYGGGAITTVSAAGGGMSFYTFTGNVGAESYTERMRIGSNGIITMSAYGVGTATFSAAGVISSVSDETWKIKDGVPVDPDSMLKKLEPGYWYYNDEKRETFGSDRQLGFYAQNVNAAIGPEAAPTPEEGKPWGYYDRSVLAVTVMSLQKALATIETLTARITALESA